MERRKFIRNTSVVAGVLAFSNGIASTAKYGCKRPPLSERKFTSKAIEDIIQDAKAKISDPEIAWLFENCFPNTLDTTIYFTVETNGRPDTFVITGDIHAMWLRDSTAYVWPYLPYMKSDPRLQQLIAGVINRQTKCLLIDAYANAFNKNKEGPGKWSLTDVTEMKPEIHERKYELDSICYPVRLAYAYWKETGDVSPFDADWSVAVQNIIKVIHEQQRFDGSDNYSFFRESKKTTGTAQGATGKGNPVKPNGMICSVFRPSDDGTIFPYLVPSNLMAVNVLRKLVEMLNEIKEEQHLVAQCNSLANQVETAINKYGIINHPEFGKIYAFEVDGFGGQLCMDDANVPSLVSLPYQGCVDMEDETYQRTRQFIFSKWNPYYFEGKSASGVGSPHTGYNKIWPMSIILRAITSIKFFK